MTAPVIVPLDPGPPKPIFMRYISLKVETKDATGATVVNEFACQVTNAGITSTGGDAVSITTLCPTGAYSQNTERTYQVTITGVQDVETMDSFMLFLWEHAGENAILTYYPVVDINGKPQGRGWTGPVILNPPDTIGAADAGTYATFTVTLPFQGGRPVMIDENGNPVTPVVATGATAGSPGSFTPTGATVADLAALNALGSLGQSSTPWTASQYVLLVDGSAATWSGVTWTVYNGARKDKVKPTDTFGAEATITASDAPNAAKLAGLGYVVDPAENLAWVTAEKFTVGTFDFHWSGTAWAAGAAL